jgi:hypothetical protein
VFLARPAGARIVTANLGGGPHKSFAGSLMVVAMIAVRPVHMPPVPVLLEDGIGLGNLIFIVSHVFTLDMRFNHSLRRFGFARTPDVFTPSPDETHAAGSPDKSQAPRASMPPQAAR